MNLIRLLAILLTLTVATLLQAQETGVFTDIEIALKYPQKVRVLDLSQQYLKKIPDTLQVFTHLNEIRLNNNDLTTLPVSLAHLENLHTVILTGNKNLNIDQAIAVLAKLPKLENLILSDCDIMFLPSSIANCTSLISLFLDSNHLLFLPNSIGSLQRLEIINLNNNYLSVLPEDIIQLQKLNLLQLENNTYLDVERTIQKLAQMNLAEVHLAHQYINGDFSKLENLHVVKLNTCHFSATPNFSATRIQELVMNNCSGIDADSLIVFVAKMASLNSFSFIDEDITTIDLKAFAASKIHSLQLNFKNLEEWNKTLFPLTRMAELNTLNLAGNEIVELPKNLNNCAALTSLNISGNKLGHSILQLRNQQLQFLNITANETQENDVKKLARQLPNCKIYHDFMVRKVLAKQLPHPDIKPNVEIFEWRGEEPKVIVLSSGSTFNIPEHAFVTAEGKPVTGPIKLRIEEFRTVKEIFASGIPMTYDSAGTQYNFKSGGMIEIRAFQNDEELKLGSEKTIAATMASISQDDFNVYNLNDSTGAWTPAGSRTVPSTVMARSGGTNYELLDSLSWYNRNSRWPSPTKEVLIFSVKRYAKLNTFTISVKKMKHPYEPSANKIYSEVSDLYAEQWIYEGQNWERDFQLIQSFTRTMHEKHRKSTKKNTYPINVSSFNGGPEMLSDFYLKKNPKSDNFILTIIFEGKVYEFPVALNPQNKKPEIVQKRFLKFYNSYTKNYTLRVKSWRDADSILEASRRATLLAMWNDMKSRSIERDGQLYIPRKALSFEIFGLGIINCDYPLPKIPENPILVANAKYISPTGKIVTAPSLTYVLDYTNNAAYRYRKGTLPSIYEKSYSVVIIELSGGKTGLVRYNQVKNAIDNKNRKPYFVFEEFQNIDELMDALDEQMASLN